MAICYFFLNECLVKSGLYQGTTSVVPQMRKTFRASALKKRYCVGLVWYPQLTNRLARGLGDSQILADLPVTHARCNFQMARRSMRVWSRSEFDHEMKVKITGSA